MVCPPLTKNIRTRFWDLFQRLLALRTARPSSFVRVWRVGGAFRANVLNHHAYESLRIVRCKFVHNSERFNFPRPSNILFVTIRRRKVIDYCNAGRRPSRTKSNHTTLAPWLPTPLMLSVAPRAESQQGEVVIHSPSTPLRAVCPELVEGLRTSGIVSRHEEEVYEPSVVRFRG